MESIKDLYNISSSIVSATLSYFFLEGPSNKAWDYKLHVAASVVRDKVSFKDETPLDERRKKIDKASGTPPDGFCLTATTIPDWCREKSRAIVKNKLIKELGEYPISRENAFWRNCDKLQLMFMIPNGGKPESGDKKTILYVHGGALVMCSANSHLSLTCKLAEESECQAASLNYRLAPEYPFPCALEDVLAAYLFLTSKSEQLGMGIHPKSITISGDSAGGNLATSFMLLLASLKQYEMIAGGLILSPWLDLTGSLPSFLTNNVDILNGPGLKYELENNNKNDRGKIGFAREREVKPWDYWTESIASSCEKWKEEITEKKHFYTNEKFLNYHLVSPLYTENFEGLPPIMIIAGDAERLRDESLITTRILLPPVTFHLYHSMPHVFQIFPFHPMAKLSYIWGSNFIRQCLSFSKASPTDPKLLENYPIGNYAVIEEEGVKLWAYTIDENLDMDTFVIDPELERLGKEMVCFSKDEEEQ